MIKFMVQIQPLIVKENVQFHRQQPQFDQSRPISILECKQFTVGYTEHKFEVKIEKTGNSCQSVEARDCISLILL